MTSVRSSRTAVIGLMLMGSCHLLGAGGEAGPLSTQTPGNALSYEKFHYSTSIEQADFERFVTAHGCSMQAFRLESTSDQDWAALFGLATKFETFDRQAEMYGFHLFSAVFMDISYAGNAEDKTRAEAEFAKHIDAQPPKVRQRVRDFLYYSAYNPDPKVMAANERDLRLVFKLLFPASYTFAKNDPMFRQFALNK